MDAWDLSVTRLEEPVVSPRGSGGRSSQLETISASGISHLTSNVNLSPRPDAWWERVVVLDWERNVREGVL